MRAASRMISPMFLGAWNRWTKDTGGKGQALKVLAMGLIIWFVLISLASQFVAQFSKYPEISYILFVKMLSVSLSAGAGITIMATTIAGLSVFFLGADIRLLLVAPVDWLDRFWSQFIRTAFTGSWAVLLVFTPILASIGRQFHWPPGFIITGLAGAIAIIALAASLGAVLSLLLAHLGGAGRARTGMALMTMAVFAGGWWMIRQGGIGSQLFKAGQGSALAMAGLLDTPRVSWAPTDWWARALMNAADRQTGVDWLALGAVWGTAIIAVCLAAGTYRFGYMRTMGRAHLNAISDHSSARISWAYETLEKWIGTRWTALLAKDMTRLVRTSSDWSHWILAGAGYALFVSNLGALSLSETEPIPRLLSQLVAVISIGVGALILASLSVHTLLPSISLEGPGVPVLRSAPIPLSLPVRTKFTWGALILIPLGTLLSVWAEQMIGGTGAWLWLAGTISASLSLGVVGLSLWFGVKYPKFDARSSGEVSGSEGATAFLFAVVGLILGCLFLVTPHAFYVMAGSGKNVAAMAMFSRVSDTARIGGLVAGSLIPSLVGALALRGAEKVGLAAKR